MANKFEVQIVALDRFTKTFRDLNNRASKAVRPLSNVQRQVGMLSKELHLDKLAKGMEKVSFASFKIAKSVGAVAPQMEALFGIGLAGGIAGAVAGIAALATRWGTLGFEVHRTASLIGVSTDDLQRFQGAAKLAGVSSDGMTKSLSALGDTLQDAVYGRNPQALVILNKLGITVKRNADGVIDSVAAFKDLSLAISRISDPRVQRLIASAFGMEEALPILRQGPDAIAKLIAEAEKLGLVIGPDGIKKADAFTESLNRMKAAIEGNANAAGGRLAPSITKAMDATTRFLTGDKKSAAAPAVDHWQAVDASRRYTWDAIKRGDWRALFGRGAQDPLHGVSGTWTPEPVGIRGNNPGNLRNPGGVGFQSFATPAAGLQAMASQLGRYYNRDHLDTISDIVNKYAPAADHNNVPAYIADVSGQTGFGAGQHLNLNDPQVMAPLLSAMVKHEQGRQPFQQGDYAQAAQTVKVEVAFANAPTGTTATAKGPGNAFVPTRVAYAMPTTVMP